VHNVRKINKTTIALEESFDRRPRLKEK